MQLHGFGIFIIDLCEACCEESIFEQWHRNRHIHRRGQRWATKRAEHEASRTLKDGKPKPRKATWAFLKYAVTPNATKRVKSRRKSSELFCSDKGSQPSRDRIWIKTTQPKRYAGLTTSKVSFATSPSCHQTRCAGATPILSAGVAELLVAEQELWLCRQYCC